MEQVKRM